MDKSWMSMNRRSREYKEGVEQFLKLAVLHASNRNSIRCPCLKCGNFKSHTLEEIKDHLIFNGVDKSYRTWIWHGEVAPSGASPSINAQFEKFKSNDVASTTKMGQVVHDHCTSGSEKFKSNEVASTTKMGQVVHDHCMSGSQEFKKLLEDAEKPLYSGCTKFTKLSALVKLYDLKARYGLSDQSFSELLKLLGDMLPNSAACIHMESVQSDKEEDPGPMEPTIHMNSVQSDSEEDPGPLTTEPTIHMDSVQYDNEEDTGPLTTDPTILLDSVQSGKPTRKKRKGRGSTYLPHIIDNRSTGVRKVVEYNQKGVPVGKVATEMTSHLGVLGRTMVPIIHDDWRRVPKELKSKLWSCVEMAYIVDPKSRKKLLSSIGSKWKTFKNTLTRLYILPFKDQPELLKYPPEKYHFIEQGHWDTFVKARLSEGFQKIRQILRERRAKNLYNHRLSRKGYAGLEEEYKRTSGMTDELDRSVLWKKAHQNKNGEYEDEAVRECVKKIDELTQQAKDGLLSPEGSIDILTLALGTPERSGRVRGVGQFVTPRTYFPMPKRRSEVEEKQKLMELQLQSLQAELKSMKELGPSSTAPVSERVNSSHPTSDVNPRLKKVVTKPKKVKFLFRDPRSKEEVTKLNKEIRKGKPCQLALGSKENIVAHGTVFETLGLDETVHTIPLGGSSVRVAVAVAIIPDALLPIPVPDELTIVSDAVGTHVAWPKDLVIPTPDEGSSIQEQSSHKNPIANGSTDIPPVLQFLIKYVERLMINDYINITIEKDIFGEEFRANLLKEDIKFLCQMKDLSDMCIVIYMRHLYQVLKKTNLDERYAFVNPSTIFGAESTNANEEGSCVLANRLVGAKPNQLYFVPCNHGYHWVLIVIDPSSMTVSYLDPMQQKIYPAIKKVINTGIKLFHAQTGKKIRKNFVWTVIECPKQLMNVECGYYVMRFMKDLIEDQSLPIIQKFNGKNTYTQAEIDEVRSEWAIAVQEYTMSCMAEHVLGHGSFGVIFETFCKACGIRSRKKRRALLNLCRKEDKKVKKSNDDCSGSSSNSENILGDSLKQRLSDLGRDVMSQRSKWGKHGRKIGKEEEAAALLMALSDG